MKQDWKRGLCQHDITLLKKRFQWNHTSGAVNQNETHVRILTRFCLFSRTLTEYSFNAEVTSLYNTKTQVYLKPTWSPRTQKVDY
jgi:hypothetical protein